MATPGATSAYSGEFGRFTEGYFSDYGETTVSSIGIGTYLGDPIVAVDRRYHEALVTAFEGGCNVVDTAINYRCQRSERIVGEALETADVDREAVMVATKGGFLPYDGERPADPRKYLRETYIDTGLVDRSTLARGSHCLAPDFLDDQLDRSLANLGLETIDLYYVHNPETQLEGNPRDEVYDQLEATFERLERRRAMGDIRGYGVATWDCFRVEPDHPTYLSLSEVCRRARAAAETVGTAECGFRAIQLPFNLGMPEAYTLTAQDGQSVLEVAREEDIAVLTSASIGQGELARRIPASVADTVPGESRAQQALTVARSAPGVTTALVGTSRREHVKDNLGAGECETISDESLADLLAGV